MNIPLRIIVTQTLRNPLGPVSKWTQFLLNIVEQGSAHLHASVADTPCTVAMSHRHLSFPPNLTIITAIILHFQGHDNLTPGRAILLWNWYITPRSCPNVWIFWVSESYLKCNNNTGYSNPQTKHIAFLDTSEFYKLFLKYIQQELITNNNNEH